MEQTLSHSASCKCSSYKSNTLNVTHFYFIVCSLKTKVMLGRRAKYSHVMLCYPNRLYTHTLVLYDVCQLCHHWSQASKYIRMVPVLVASVQIFSLNYFLNTFHEKSWQKQSDKNLFIQLPLNNATHFQICSGEIHLEELHLLADVLNEIWSRQGMGSNGNTMVLNDYHVHVSLCLLQVLEMVHVCKTYYCLVLFCCCNFLQTGFS